MPSAFTLAFAGWEAVTPWVYLVKINLIPAMSRTVARQIEIARTAKRLLPSCDPMIPPIIAAVARTNPSEGMVRTFVK